MKVVGFLILFGIVTGCDSNLSLQTSGTHAIDCTSNPDDENCANVKSLTIGDVKEYLRADDLDVTWNVGGVKLEKVKFKLSLASASDCAEVNKVVEVEGSLTGTLRQIQEGVYYICLDALFDGQTVPASNNGLRIVVDRTAPVLGDLAEIITNSPATLNPTATDISSMTFQWTDISGPAPIAFGSPEKLSTIVTMSAEGVYNVLLSASDEVGNSATKQYQITYDTTPPVVNAGADRSANATITQVGTANADAISLQWTKVSGPGAITFGDSAAATTTVAAAQDGTYEIRLTATDAAGNSAYDEFTLVWNTSGPAFASLVKSGDAGDGYINDSEKAGNTAIFTLNAAGYTAASYSAPLATTTVCDGSVTYSSSNVTTAADLPSDGDWVVCVKLEDAALNVAYGKSEVVNRDTAYPQFTSAVGDNEADDDYVNGAEASAANAIIALSASGYDEVSYSDILADSALSCDGDKSYDNTSIPLIDSMPGINGAYAVCVKLSDDAGNITYGKSSSITRYVNTPTLTLTSGTTYINASNVNSFSVSGACSDNGRNVVISGAVAASETCSGNTWSKALDFSSVADGPVTLKGDHTDVAGNVAAQQTLNLTKDTDPPQFSSLALANDAADGYINPVEIAADKELVSAVVGSGFDTAQYALAHHATSCSLIAVWGAADALPTAAALSSSTSGNSYKICVKLTDNAGNTPAYGNSSNFVLDKVAPVPSAIALYTRNVGQHSIELNWAAASDAYTSAANLQYKVYYSTSSSFDTISEVEAGTEANNFTANITSYTVTNLSPNTTYYLNVVVKDEAGNKAVYTAIADDTHEVAFIKLAVGRYHTCGITSEGAGYCWGYNVYGQIGNNSTVDSSKPTAISGSLRFTDIAAGGFHTCGLTDAGSAYCWGFNDKGQLGNGSTTNASVPTEIPGFKFKAIAANHKSACAITVEGQAYCWGDDSKDILGNGASTTYQPSPVAVVDMPLAESLTVGEHHACAIAGNGDVYCWGTSSWGEVGSGTGIRTTATIIYGSHKFKEVHAGVYHTCGLRGDGIAFCWGRDEKGQIGNGSTISDHQLSPVQVNNQVFRRIHSSSSHTCGIQDDGLVYCWGYGNGGNLGTGNTLNSHEPIAVISSERFRDIAAGASHTCGITDKGETYCWGQNSMGEVGDGTTTLSNTPQLVDMSNVAGGMGWWQVTAGHGHGCGLRANGKAYCWGAAQFGSVGHGSTVSKSMPVAVDTSERFISLGAGSYHTCGVTGAGKIFCWGDAQYGRLGNNATVGVYASPIEVQAPLTRFLQMEGGGGHSCAVSSTGAIYCWGWGLYGQLGISGSTADFAVPTAITNPVGLRSTYTSVDAGVYHTCGLVDDGTINCWGYNGTEGRIGDGTSVTRDTPTAVSGGKTYVGLSVGSHHSCAIKNNGVLDCWGSNSYGNVGDGTLVAKTVPTQIDASNQYIAVGATYERTCGIRADGSMHCWGDNQYGGIGDGTTTSRSTPTAVSGVGSLKFKSTGGLSISTFGLTSTGGLWAWGYGGHDANGDGSNMANLLVPGPVVNKVTIIGSSASAVYLGDVTSKAHDDNIGTSWSANGSVAWIQLDLGRTKAIKKIRLYVNQTPDGNTVHNVKGGVAASSQSTLYTFNGFTTNNTWIEWNPHSPALENRFITIDTTLSPSWVAWGEIEIYE